MSDGALYALRCNVQSCTGGVGPEDARPDFIGHSKTRERIDQGTNPKGAICALCRGRPRSQVLQDLVHLAGLALMASPNKSQPIIDKGIQSSTDAQYGSGR